MTDENKESYVVPIFKDSSDSMNNTNGETFPDVMKTSRVFSKQRRIATQRDAALLVCRLWRRAALSALVIALSGCTFSAPSSTRIAQNASKRNSSATKTARQNSLTKSSSAQNAITQNANSTSTRASVVGAWWNAWRNGAARNGAETIKQTAAPMPLVFIDIESLARRNPSWKLAEELSSSHQIVRLSTPNARIEKPELATTFFRNRVLDARPDDVSAPQITTFRVASSLQNGDESALQNRAQINADSNLNSFLSDAAKVQSAARRMDEEQSRAALQDEIAAAYEVVLPPLVPAGLPPEVQLEITNLRLKLLPNSNTSVEERAQAQARLFRLQEVWKQRLRDQEEQLLQEWTRQRDEEPRRVEREGEAQIAQQNARARRNDAARLAILRDEQTRFLEGDFADASSLGILLPSFSQRKVGDVSVARAPVATRNFALPRTSTISSRNVLASSFSAAASVENVRGGNNQRVAQLRALALKDARRWAKNLARSRDWRLSERAVAGARDETSTALQLLGASS